MADEGGTKLNFLKQKKDFIENENGIPNGIPQNYNQNNQPPQYNNVPPQQIPRQIGNMGNQNNQPPQYNNVPPQQIPRQIGNMGNQNNQNIPRQNYSQQMPYQAPPQPPKQVPPNNMYNNIEENTPEIVEESNDGNNGKKTKQKDKEKVKENKTNKSFFGQIDYISNDKKFLLSLLVVLIFVILNSKIVWTQIQRIPLMGKVEPSIIALVVNSLLSGIIFYFITLLIVK